MITTGIDVGSASVKVVAVHADEQGGNPVLIGSRLERIRRRDLATVVDLAHEGLLADLSLEREQLAYVATTGEGDWIPFSTGHFYGMTTHARGGLLLEPEARGVLDVGALHARAILVDPRSRVLGSRMTSQCASGSGQFLENIARYLGVGLPEVGRLSLEADAPEKVSSICAVLSETDVINMVSRGIRTENILAGIHLSMGERYAKLIRTAGIRGVVIMTGGLAEDVGLVAAIRSELAKQGTDADLRAHPNSVLAGALGAAAWGAFRRATLDRRRTAGAA